MKLSQVRNVSFMMMIIICMFLSCKQTTQNQSSNPLLAEWNTPFGLPPFEQIKPEHYEPAFRVAIEEHKKEIDSIVRNIEEPTFQNTVAALEYSGELLKRINAVFTNMLAAHTSGELQQVAQNVQPLITEHYDQIYMNDKLFARVKFLYDRKQELQLNDEEKYLLELTYKNFVRYGALLTPEQKQELMNINKELAVLTLKFGDNLLAETNNYELLIENENDLDGLPANVIEAAADEARKRGKDGKWVFTLHNPSVIPFLQFARNRELRRQIHDAYIRRGDNGNEYDNKEIIKKIVQLRIRKAQLLGYKTFAHYVLEMNMAQTPENVFALLDRLWAPALKRARAERDQYQKIIYSEGNTFKLEPHDWRYYAEKYRKKYYDLDENELKPYFELNNVQEGIFYVVRQLYGLQFRELTDVPKYHPDAVVYEVLDSTGNHVGILYMDFHPRESKRGGAWMNLFRQQYRKHGKNITPVVTLVCNFTRPTSTTPSLLTIDEVLTFFHEFGHALHGLLSDGIYPSISSTNVPRDFVELPSQIMEHWALQPEVLKVYAKHYQTGNPIPDALIQKIQNAQLFDQGFATVEYLAASYLDMYWHTLEQWQDVDVNAFEQKVMQKIGLIPEIISRYRSTYFAHIFRGGYSAGYYSYIWCGVLDHDAFEAFKENGIFDRTTAMKFREHILSAGHRAPVQELYKNFRGKDPDITPLLKARGLL